MLPPERSPPQRGSRLVGHARPGEAEGAHVRENGLHLPNPETCLSPQLPHQAMWNPRSSPIPGVQVMVVGRVAPHTS